MASAEKSLDRPQPKSRKTELPPREFSLVTACCRWPPDARRNAAIQEAARADIDWQKVLRVARRHRVVGLVRNGMMQAKVSIPAAIIEALAANARRIALHNVATKAEIIRIKDTFAAAAIPVNFFKGPLVGILAYGSQAIKFGRDIDLLVPSEFIRAGVAQLENDGYRVLHPLPEDPALLRAWLTRFKEIELQHPERGTLVELHWNLVQNTFHAAQLNARLRPREIEIMDGVSVPTFSDDMLFVYLCIHGARCGWFRLKWLADVGALMAQKSDEELVRCIELARSCRAEPCVAQAILLCDRLLKIDVAAPAARQYRRFARYRLLEWVALRMMVGGNAETELFDIRFGTAPAILCGFLLGNGWRFLWAEFRLLAINPPDMEQVPLPRALRFLYVFLRLPLFLLRRIKDRGLGAGGSLQDADRADTQAPSRGG